MRTRKLIRTTAAGLILGGATANLAIAQAPVVIDDTTVAAPSSGIVSSGEVSGGAVVPYNTYGGHDLFHNFYTQGHSNQANAGAYISPVPVPPNVGHTFYTYQPLYPHEMMHWHHNRYHNYYDNGSGLNRTKVHYYAPPVRTGLNYAWRKIQLPRP